MSLTHVTMGGVEKLQQALVLKCCSPCLALAMNFNQNSAFLFTLPPKVSFLTQAERQGSELDLRQTLSTTTFNKVHIWLFLLCICAMMRSVYFS